MDCAWKPDWEQTKQHFLDWWNRDGLILGLYSGSTGTEPHAIVPDPGPALSIADGYTDRYTRTDEYTY